MRVVLVEPDLDARTQLVAMLRGCGIGVAPFADARTAFLFLLARLEELDGILVNEDAGDWSRWLRCRVEMVSVLPVASYSGRHPEREARIHDELQRIGREAHPTAEGR